MSFIPLIAGKMKIASSVGVAGVSMVSVPVTLSIKSTQDTREFFSPVNKALETVKTKGGTHFNGLDKQLQSQYVNFGNKVVGETEQNLSAAGAKMDEIRKLGETSASFLNDNGEEINYHAFQLGALIKALVRQMPTIVRDSFLDLLTKGKGNNLLSAQKIYAIAKNEKFKEFVESLSKVVTKYEDIMSKITNKDLDGVMQIFRELPNGQIDQFLGKVKSNSENLEDDASAYCATKLMMHVLIGKEEIERLKSTVNELKTKLDTMEDSLKKILSDVQVDISSFKQQLETLSDSPKIKDPCPTKK